MATITTINGSDAISTSDTVINTNFANLNSDKIETSVLDTDTALTANSDAKIATQKAVKAYADSFISPINTVYPVGSIYLSTVATNPGTVFGVGTWTAYGAGRVLVGAGTGSVVATFASRASNVITVTGLTDKANNEFQTGQAVFYATTGTVITGLSDDTTYYVVRVTNTSFSLATSLANAQNGTVITLSGDGTGTQTFTVTFSVRAVSETGGQENHAMSSTELLAHTHSFSAQNGGDEAGATSVVETGNTINNTATSASTGGNAAMNIMQPFIVCYMWLRTA